MLFIYKMTSLKSTLEYVHIIPEGMLLYVLVKDVKDILKLFNNTHVFDLNISEKCAYS